MVCEVVSARHDPDEMMQILMQINGCECDDAVAQS